jgi:serine/threonine-protein kinase
MSLTPSTRIGPYEIVCLLGAGGMGEVYRARDAKLNRDVALKILPPLVANDPDRLARFRREAQVLASLNDPHIAQIYGFEDSAETHALVMELVEGPTLAERIAPGPLPVPDALAIARQIASALDAAHEHGIVHRDLKPANVKVREDGTVKVLDFGLAKALAPAGELSPDAANSPTMSAHATEMGMILGTAAYMAPEQARGRSVDKRADIWAFGVVLFEMLTGRQLFTGETISDTLAAVLRQEIDWTTLPADTPARVRQLLRRCLDRDPKQRLRDIGEATIALDAPDDPPARAGDAMATRRSWRGLAWTLAALAIGVALGFAISAWRRPAPAPGQILRNTEVIEGFNGLLTMSRDGTEVAYAHSVPGGPAIVLRRMDALDAAPIPGAIGMPETFSPDGRWLVYAELHGQSLQSLRRIPVSGGASTLLCDGCVVSAPAAWGDDGAIVVGGPHGLIRVPASGGAPTVLTTVDVAHGEAAHLSPQWLPGGRQLLFTVVTSSGGALAVFDPATGRSRTIAKTGFSNRYVSGGYLTYARDGTLFVAPFDVQRLTIAGPEVPVVQDVLMRQATWGPIVEYAVSETGLLTYLAQTAGAADTTLAWSDRAGVTHALPGPSQQPTWGTGRLSPDGRFVANSLTRDGHQNIWVLETARGTLARLSFDGLDDHPIWTPDGRAIVYWSSRTPPAQSGLYRVAADGSSRPTLVLATNTPSTPTSMSPDGRWLLVDRTGASGTAGASNASGRIFLVALGANGSADDEPRPLHDASASERDGEISPDGQWAAYVSSETGDDNVYVQPFPGPGPRIRVTADRGSAPRWAPGGRELYYMGGSGAASNALMSVAIPPGTSLRPGVPTLLFQKRVGTTWDVTPDRNRFLVELAGDDTTTAMFVTVANWTEELRRGIAAAQ